MSIARIQCWRCNAFFKIRKTMGVCCEVGTIVNIERQSFDLKPRRQFFERVVLIKLPHPICNECIESFKKWMVRQ